MTSRFSRLTLYTISKSQKTRVMNQSVMSHRKKKATNQDVISQQKNTPIIRGGFFYVGMEMFVSIACVDQKP